jgi:protein-S-isoprenylcysteine O-methyltransferase Ste14
MSPLLSLYLIWVIWVISWIGAAFWSAPTIRHVAMGRQLAYRLLVLAGYLLLFGFWSPRYMAMTQLWRPPESTMWALDGVAALGLGFCWWARVHLGTLWSSNVTRKQDHQIIDTGPYALVRHPIYTGIIVAAFASAALEGTLVALVGAVVMTFGWYLKAKLEETFLREELGPKAYDDYAGRTAMLIPFVRF